MGKDTYGVSFMNLLYNSDGYYNDDTPNPFLIKVLNYLKPGKALDLGCGNGRNSKYIKNRGWEVSCFDIDKKAINLCLQAGLNAKRMDILNKDIFDNHSFDLIMCFYVYQHLNLQQQLILSKRIWDALVCDGWFLWGAFLDKRMLLPPKLIFPDNIFVIEYCHSLEKIDETHGKNHSHKGIILSARKKGLDKA